MTGPDAPRNDTVRVLVVDDDELQIRAIQRLVRRDPRIELHVSTAPMDTLRLVDELQPDLVILDSYMPGLDGVTLCGQIGKQFRAHPTPVVVASGSMDAKLAAQAVAAGAVRAIHKPVDVSALLPLARRMPEEPAVPAPSKLAVGTGTNPRIDTSSGRPQIRGADLLVSMLEQAGVEVVFGLPGGAISPVHDALIGSPIRHVTTRHESGAMFAAAGYAHSTGKLAVVAVTSGPGCLNAMTGLASAWCDGLPVLLLVGEVPRAAHGKGVLQDGSAHGLQLVDMARPVTKLAAEVARPSALPHMMRRAIATALSGRKGPVMLTLPLDVTMSAVSIPRFGGSVRIGEVLDPEVVDELAELVTRAKRPLIVAGSGVRGDGAPARLVTVAERARCPVATTPKAKGVFPESHALSLGVLGMGGHPSARDYLDGGVDLVLAIGTSLGDLATDGFATALQAETMIHVDIDARQIGRSYEPTHAVVASAKLLLGELADRLEGTIVERPTSHGVVRRRLATASTPHRIAPQDALEELQSLLPRDTIFTVDSGDHFMFSTHFLRIDHPDAYVVMTGLGSMGQSIGAAIGAQLANPTRSVAAICGDGCFAMNAFEIATAVAENLPIRVFVFNDQRLGMVENGHAKVYGRKPSYPTGPLDVCKIASGLGATTFRIDGTNQLAEAREILGVARGPLVFDVQIDPAVLFAGRDRVAAMNAPFAPPVSGEPSQLMPSRRATIN